MAAFDQFFLVIFPYIAVFGFLVAVWYRYKKQAFTVSSLSSSFLEAEAVFWGVIPFHIGILILFFGHLIGFLFPAQVLAWNAVPLRLLILEITAFGFGLCVLWGLVVLLCRRLSHGKIRVVTSPMDIAVEALLIAQVVLGLYTAYRFRWGSSWYAAVLSPYLWSLVKFSPQTAAVTALPLVVKLHIIGAFLILLLVPFSRLMHFLVVPLHYIFRPYQRVVWYWDRKKVRDPARGWNVTQPKNN